MKYSLRAVNTDGTMPGDGLLNEFSKLDVNITFSDVGDCKFEYPVNGANATKLIQQREIAVFDDQGEVPDTRFVIEDRNGNLVAKDGVLYRSWQGRNLYKSFADAIVYPSDWPTNPSVTGGRSYAAVTPGNLMSSLINLAQARGELPGITYNFNNTQTSNGVAWAYTYTVDIKAGVNLLQVMQNLVDNGVIEFRMVGRQLQAYNPNGFGTDRSVAGSQLALWASRNVSEVPEHEVSRDLKNAALVEGKDKRYVEVTDATSIAQWGRRAMIVSQTQVDDNGTLTVIGQAMIDKQKQPRRERTTKFTIDSNTIPQRSFLVGDWVLSDSGSNLEKMRVRQAVINVDGKDTDGECTVVLNDKFMELEVALTRKVEGLIGSSQQGSPGEPGSTPDTLAPAVPTGLVIASTAYVDANGVGYAAAHFDWNAVTTNSDGSSITDLDTYVVRILNDSKFEYLWVPQPASEGWFSPLWQGQYIEANVGAYDKAGNFSGWSGTVSHNTANDTTPPPVASTPIVNVWLGAFKITWDGLGSAGEAMPLDFKYAEVHMSTVNNFTPDNTTLMDTLPVKGVSVITGVTYGTPYYFKLITVDTADNKAAASAQATATPVPIVGSDITPGHIGFEEIGFKDLNNLAFDGSFENDAMDSERLAGGSNTAAFSYLTDTPFHGTRYLRGTLTTNPSTLRTLMISPVIPCRQGDTFWVRAAMRRSATADGTNLIAVKWTLQNNTTSIITAASQPAANGAWTDTQGTIAAPANAKSAQFYVQLGNTATTGTIDFDAVEIRQVNGTVLIQDLAVNNAKISDVSAAKITVGTLTADVTLSARIKTADTGGRVELNSLGIGAWNNSGVQTVSIGIDGNVSIAGTFDTYPSGKRIEINPGTSNLPEIRYYPSAAGGRYAYMCGYPVTSTNEGMLLGAARDPSGPDTAASRHGMLILDHDTAWTWVGSESPENTIGQFKIEGQGNLGLWARTTNGSIIIEATNASTGDIRLDPGNNRSCDVWGILKSDWMEGTAANSPGVIVSGGDARNRMAFYYSGASLYVWNQNTNGLIGPI